MRLLRHRRLVAATSGGGSAFSPASIAGLKLWLDASQITGLNDGDAVGTWADLSGNGYDATQATGSKKPTYQTNELNSRPVVSFDGVDDYMGLTSAPIAMTANYTLFCVIRKPAGAAYVVHGGGGGWDLAWNVSGSNKKQFVGSAGIEDETGTSVKLTQTCVVFQPSTRICKVDGVDVILTNTAFGGTNHRVGIGAFDGVLYGTQDIAELFYTTQAVNAGVIEAAQAYLMAKWGI